MGIQKFVFFSIHNCDKHPEVPLMEIKYCTEKFLRDSGVNHVVIRLCGFMQVNTFSLWNVWLSFSSLTIKMLYSMNLLLIFLETLTRDRCSALLWDFFGIFWYYSFHYNTSTSDRHLLIGWMVIHILPGPDWTVCSTHIGGEICLGHWCSYKNSIHGHPGKLL